MGRDDFLNRYHFGKSTKYLLIHNEKTYDSKAIFGVAHGFATEEFLAAKDFSGGVDAAAGYLQDLGFEIVPCLDHNNLVHATTEPIGSQRVRVIERGVH